MFKIIFGILFHPFWFLIKYFPRQNNLWVFGSWFGFRYSDNTKELFEYVVDNETEVVPIWITQSWEVRQRVRSNGQRCYMRHSLLGIYYCLRASIFIFSSGKQDINPMLMNGAVSIQTWHGSPLKKIGLDNKYAINSRKQELVRVFFPFYYEYNYSFVVSCASYFNDYLSSAFNISKANILTTGYPRNDVFFSEKKSNIINSLDERFNSPKKIAYLPTFRDGEKDYDLFFQFGFDLNAWNHYLERSNSLLILKAHFAANNSENNISSDRIIFVSDEDEPDVNLLLKFCDILITDYSGAYFDFLLTGRAIILAPFDIDYYIGNCRELYFNYNKLKHPSYSNWVDILDYIEIAIENSKDLFETAFNEYYDGNSSKRLVNAIIDLNQS